ncbi:DEAD/DEAH box helicase [Rhodobacter ferrooxidans]|uniref:DEAD/DEAH box helicase domain protein n=1 Tax=Rhodobacter ferrooxidans TaxID=371731 RepID=C8RXA8_9RHOB|nr:DEAD/DEAH box helicase [Rhodobacter sp. SW2]EEW26633.1 DEAD/DEAH box helicase domain protein [Rhodobacter sp. SW2]
MTHIEIAAPLAAALAAKGYETLTPVQDAVLSGDVTGRDLLVSAQTGSGKTVAFGIAIADELLRGADRLLFADTPMALIIAPTRELALQVARELDWLYAETGAIIATCVGGMDYRTEKRALDRGAHIVVGTPGRLRDHIERRSLDLSGLRAAVLDEADEMLDLGFREDLEFILQAAPAERRTLMFSATVPKAIAELAKDFQNNALRLQTAGEARQHVDIEYRALNVSTRDREHAIFNLLRFYEARSAIVFCKTRVAVNHLLARMGNRGFQVVALSGELSQQERTHALQSLRDGRARVCIATDVAARGIDLPGLDLVIHADLPSNSEVLLHRSGRTGRAGSKGVSALIVTPAEFRKAQRLLQGAKVVAEWAKAPSADEVQMRDDARVLEHPVLMAPAGNEAEIAATLLERFGAEQVASAFVRLWREGRSAPEELQDANAAPSAARERTEFGESVWFALSVGRSGRAEARWLLPKICDGGGITKNEIGAIRVQEDETFVQIAKPVASRFGASFELESGVVMRRMEGEPSMDRPERAPRKVYEKPSPRPARDDDAPRAPRADKPAYVPKPPRVVEEGDALTAYKPKVEDTPKAPYVAPEAAEPAPAPKKPYVKREAAETAEAPRKPYVKRDEAPKPYAPRDDAPRKPYVKRDDAPKPYAKRDDAPAKPWAPRADGPKAPYAPRAEGAKKPYVKRDDAAAKPYGAKPYAKREDGPAKPYAKRDDAGAKPYAPRRAAEAGADADSKPRWKAGDKPAGKPFGAKPAAPRSAGFKSLGGGKTESGEARPGRAAGFKSHAAEGKSFGKPGFAKAKPAAAKVDAKDTSKRFTPPRKPKA